MINALYLLYILFFCNFDAKFIILELLIANCQKNKTL